MDIQPVWAGVDTSTRTYAVCIVDKAGGIVDQCEMQADPAKADAFLTPYSDRLLSVAMETGTTSIHLARVLTAIGYPVAVYDALKVHRFLALKANKTDANDATGMAQVARLGGKHLAPVYQRPIEFMVLRSKLVVRERLVKMRRVNEGAMMSLFHAFGVRASGKVTSVPSLRRIVTEMLQSAETAYRVPLEQLACPLVELSAQLRREELRLESELKSFATSDETCRRLMDIPGVGVITAISFVTAICDPTRFRRAADVGAYFGLTPKIWKTGNFSRRRGISKLGSSLTRKHLHNAARQILDSRMDSSMQRWGRSLSERSNRRKAVIAVARKLAVVMLTMWRNGSKFELAH